MGTSRKQVGDLGEGLACSYLESRGHTILRKNWRIGHLEVDIISRDAQGLHFVEAAIEARNDFAIALNSKCDLIALVRMGDDMQKVIDMRFILPGA